MTMAGLPTQVDLRTQINGRRHELTVPMNRLLVDLLRDDLGLTGTKLGCSVGICGACSVLIDGELQSACLLLAVTVQGKAVTTIEGIAAEDGSLSSVRIRKAAHCPSTALITVKMNVLRAVTLPHSSSR